MYDVILELVDNPEEVGNLSEIDLESFVGSVADYAGEEWDIENAVERLKSYAGDSIKVSKIPEEITKEHIYKITIVDKLSYFREKYETFLKALNDLKDVATLDNFAGNSENYAFDYKLLQVESTAHDKYEAYVYEEGTIYTLTDWMRSVKNGDEFYLGLALAYHA